MSAIPMSPLDVLSLALINEHTDSESQADLSGENELLIRVGA